MSGIESDASLHRKLSSHEPPLLTTVSISPGNRVTLSVTFEADEPRIDGAWWIVANSVVVLASALDFYGFCPFRSFEVGFSAAWGMKCAQKTRQKKDAYDRMVHAPLPD